MCIIIFCNNMLQIFFQISFVFFNTIFVDIFISCIVIHLSNFLNTSEFFCLSQKYNPYSKLLTILVRFFQIFYCFHCRCLSFGPLQMHFVIRSELSISFIFFKKLKIWSSTCVSNVSFYCMILVIYEPTPFCTYTVLI